MKKQYKLKEEAKKYFDKDIRKTERPLNEWEYVGITIEALEEVESKIKIGYQCGGNKQALTKSTYNKFTEQ